MIRLVAAVWVICFTLAGLPARAESGVTETSIRFGQSAAIGGPAGKLGIGMRDGILAAFKEINDRGGINGRHLELVTLDDGYEPEQAIRNAHELIGTENVFALAGGVGTPTSQAVESILSEARIPYIGAFTGAEFLRNPYKRYVVNVRPSYYEEAERIVEYLAEQKGHKRIAILYQDDSFGRAGLEGVQRALDLRKLSLISEETYKRNTVAVKRAALALKAAQADAVVMVGTYQPIASYIRLCRELGLNPEFVALSFVGSEALAEELGPEGAGTLISEVVPFPFRDDSQVSASYRRAFRDYKADASFGYISFEGYIVGRLIGAVLVQLGPDVSRESFIEHVATAGTIKIDDLQLAYGRSDNQGLDNVYFTIIDEKGKIAPFEPDTGAGP